MKNDRILFLPLITWPISVKLLTTR